MKILLATNTKLGSLARQYGHKAWDILNKYENVEKDVRGVRIKDFPDYDVGIGFLYEYKIPYDQLDKMWINFHPGILPWQAGRGIAYRAIMEGHKFCGGSMHYMDINFDTGPIIQTQAFLIKDSMTATDVVLQSYDCLLNLFSKYIEKIISGEKLIGIPQSNTMYSNLKINDYIELSESQAKAVRALTCGDFFPRIKVGERNYKVIPE